MKKYISRQINDRGKWTGFYKFVVQRSPIIAHINFDLSFEEAYFKYSTLQITDMSGDMTHYKETGKIRVPARSEKW